MSIISENIACLRERIYNRAIKAGRNPEEIILVAVSKMVGINQIKDAREAGITTFGESYIQEARQKIPQFSEEVKWHLVGHLQTNKVKYVLPLFSMIHSVDSIRLAQEISQRATQLEKTIEVLIQVNIGRENTKSGVSPEELPGVLETVYCLPGIAVKGLMTMPPYFPDSENVRPFFKKMRELRDNLLPSLPEGVSLPHLSMGISSDYEVAIDEGATILRIGTAIFGERK